MNVQAVKHALSQSWSSRTSSKWTAQTPASGQCSVTALVIQDCFGGELLKTKLDEGWHFYNQIEGCIYDFTASQFINPIAYTNLLATRLEALADSSAKQYAELAETFSKNYVR